jgi:hypothetical protein
MHVQTIAAGELMLETSDLSSASNANEQNARQQRETPTVSHSVAPSPRRRLGAGLILSGEQICLSAVNSQYSDKASSQTPASGTSDG